jgi:hypothetical protein
MADSFLQVVDFIFSSLLSVSNLMVTNQLLQMSLSVGVLLLVWKIYKLLL